MTFRGRSDWERRLGALPPDPHQGVPPWTCVYEEIVGNVGR